MTTRGRYVGVWLCISLGAASLGRAQAPDRVEEILRRVYPQAEKVEKRFVYLTRDQQAEVEKRARVRPVPRLYRFYEVRQGATVVGYGVTDTHILRTHYETLLVVLDGDGRVRQVEVLAFEEPPDYRPSDKWLRRFQGHPLDDRLWLGRDVPNITGATITATAVLRSVRTVLAVWQVVYGGGR